MTTKRNANIMAALPFAVIGSTEEVVTPDGRRVKGRQYSWGCAEVENDEHCDFRKLRSLLIRTHMLDLITTTEELHYENYRQTQMETRKFGDPRLITMVPLLDLYIFTHVVHLFIDLNPRRMLNSRKRKKCFVSVLQNKSRLKKAGSENGSNK